MTDDSVIIVGAGPVGLGAALELARCGVRSVLIEKHDGVEFGTVYRSRAVVGDALPDRDARAA